jgi:hypothetical protein
MLSALPYHLLTTEYFKAQPLVWKFFSNNTYKSEQLIAFKTDLLKNSYKFDPLSEPALYGKVQIAKEKLGMATEVTIYQAENTLEDNASIVYLDGETHILFSGKIIQLMSDEELLAIISHELSHVQLYTQLNGEVEIADRIITAIANHQDSVPAQYETARLFKLYTEIFCDRGAFVVAGDYKPIIASLVKLATGLHTVNADSYIKQAEEIFSIDANYKTMGVTHPENFIRARAIWLWNQKGPDAEPLIQKMIEGYTGLDELDLFKQQHVSALTEQVIRILLSKQWMQTPHTISLAKQYFGQIDIRQAQALETISSQIEHLHPYLQDYLGYVMYDFAVVDKELEDIPLGYCFFLADEFKLAPSFAGAVKKERKLTDKKIATLKKQTLMEYQIQLTQAG